MTTKRRITVYEIDNHLIDDWLVAAYTARQAHVLVNKRVWINPAVEHPVGIVAKRTWRGAYHLWCGCEGHGIGGDPDPGDGILALRRAIAAHHCPKQVSA